MSQKSLFGFTLAELLIALAILGIIATFAIPKVLQSQQSGRANAITKETISMFASAYSAYKLNNTPSSSTEPSNLTQYMNYVAIDTSSLIDAPYNQTGSRACGTTVPCLVLHNGAKVYNDTINSFGGTSTTNYIYATVDPDGVLTSPGTTNGPDKGVDFIIYFNGRVSLLGNCRTGDSTTLGVTPQVWCPGNSATIPPWFSW